MKLNFDVILLSRGHFFGFNAPFDEKKLHGKIADDIWCKSSVLKMKEFNESFGPMLISSKDKERPAKDRIHVIYD